MTASKLHHLENGSIPPKNCPKKRQQKTSSITPPLFVYFCKWTFNLSISVAYIRYMDFKSTKNLIQCQRTVRPDFIRIKKCSVIKTLAFICLSEFGAVLTLALLSICIGGEHFDRALQILSYIYMVAVLSTPFYKYTCRSVKIHHQNLVEKYWFAAPKIIKFTPSLTYKLLLVHTTQILNFIPLPPPAPHPPTPPRNYWSMPL